MRSVPRQIWPVFSKPARATPFTVFSRSQSAKTSVGFLPPSSRLSFLKAGAAVAATIRPLAVPPVAAQVASMEEVVHQRQAEVSMLKTELRALLERVVHAAQLSLARTPDLLPVLKQAGVVDSGGKGLTILLEGMLRFLRGQPLDFDPLGRLAERALVVADHRPVIEPSGGGAHDLQLIDNGIAHTLDLLQPLTRGGHQLSDVAAEGLEQRQRDRVAGHAQAHRVLAAGDLQRCISALQDQGERPRPEAFRQAPGRVRYLPRPVVQVVQAGEMDDDRVVRRPALGREDAPHRLGIAGVGAEPIDGLGGEGDQTADPQYLGGRFDVAGRKVVHQ